MKIFSLLALTVSAQYTNWNWWQSYIHLHYKGGIANFIRDDLKDRGFPADFLSLWENATDYTIMSSVAAWTSGDRGDFASETSAGRSLFTFYAAKINAAAMQAIDRDALEAIVYTDFLATQIPADLDLDTLMNDIVEENFDSAVSNAQTWAEKIASGNFSSWTTDPGAENHVAVIQTWKRAMSSYGAAVNLKKSAAAVVEDYAQIGSQIVQAGLFAWEAQTDVNYVAYMAYQKFMSAMEDVLLGPIFMMCEKEIGPFGMLNLMSVHFAELFSWVEIFQDFDDEVKKQYSMLFFGDEDHIGFDLTAWLEKWVFDYTEEFGGTGDIQAKIHLMSMLFDDAIFPTVYSLVSCPICGICDAPAPADNSTVV